jgi:hypothetical protein
MVISNDNLTIVFENHAVSSAGNSAHSVGEGEAL